MRIPKGQLESLSEVSGTVIKGCQWRVLVRVKGETEWVGNQLRFSSLRHAREYAADLVAHWRTVEEWKIVEVEKGE